MDKLEPTKRYAVTYRIPGHRKDLIFIGDYLGFDSVHRRYQFSLRPDAGTTSLNPGWIKKVELATGQNNKRPVVLTAASTGYGEDV